MNCEAVYHKTGDQYCYQRNQDELVIHIRTGYDIESVILAMATRSRRGFSADTSAGAGRSFLW